MSPSVPEAPFEVESLDELESRASAVYTHWAQTKIGLRQVEMLQFVSVEGDLWIEPIEVDVETAVNNTRPPKNILAAIFGGTKSSGSEELHKVGQCLDDMTADFEHVIGRDALINEVDRMLQRDDRQGVMIVGQPSTGKSAIFRACVKRRADRYRESKGSRPQVWWLAPQRLISGMSYLGQWEQRWLAILREATKRDHILYFDDLVTFFSAGRTRDSSLSAADVLRSYLSEHRVRIVVEATSEELAILRRRDRALADRFHLVHVPSLDSEASLPIVLEAAQQIEVRDGVYFHPEVVPLVMRQQEILSPDKAFPGKSIDMVRSLGKHAASTVQRNSVLELAAQQTGSTLPFLVDRMGQQSAIRHHIEGQIIGQPDAVAALARIVVRFAQNLQPNDRPLGVLLFLGPTGVGKTESAKALTRLLFEDDSHLVRLDMNELTTPFAAEQLVGSFDEPDGRLTAAVRRKPNCVILLDEIEKAHPDVFDYLLQVLGEGRLTDARGRVADFRSSIIIMTSNLGAREQTAGVGFDVSPARQSQVFTKAAQSFFRPEFFNRIDEVIAFRSLDTEDIKQIVQIQLEQVLARDGIKRRRVFVAIDEKAVQTVVDAGFDAQFGARAVRRMLEREVIQPLGDVLAALSTNHPTLVRIVEQDRVLKCQTRSLSIAAQREYEANANLEQLVEVGKELQSKLDSQLTLIADELRSRDEELKLHNHNASYYALREQVYHCGELLKVARYRLNQKNEPRLDTAPGPSAVKRKVDGHRLAGTKRFLREWIYEEDMRQTISEGQSERKYDQYSNRDLASQVSESLILASALVAAALTPRRWLVGIKLLTTDAEYQRRLEFHRSFNDYLALHGMRDAPSLLPLLAGCLKNCFQYEVLGEEFSRGYYLVSGVSLIGLLGPLLGTYQTQVKQQASHLRSLHAIPITENLSVAELNEIIRTESVASSAGLLTSPEQLITSDVIRGSMGREIVDYVSGSRCLVVGSENWTRADVNQERFRRWWMQCMPIPPELRSARGTPVPSDSIEEGTTS
jgi:ATP-dependent Clp protease ATP-binding subunit ClpA